MSNYDGTVVSVLPAQYYEEAEAKLQAARNSGRRTLTAYDLLKEDLEALSARIPKRQLQNGHTYGYLYWSPNATAERNGQMLPNHGEIYICVGTYRADIQNGCLVTATAWGGDCFEPVRNNTLLLEFPSNEQEKEDDAGEDAEINIEIGGKYIFDTHGGDSTWNSRSGSEVTVLRALTEAEADIADVGPMYRVAFLDGVETDVFLDELVKKAKEV